jgi:glycosyltransferase involved in cell wall biosynthesis
MTKQLPLRVVIVGPPLSASGGIGRVMSYTLSAIAAENLNVRVLDTRGLRSSPWSSLVPLLRTCGTLLLISALGKIDVAHVNISSHGSALRKGLVVRVCRLARIPVVLHLHASSFPEFYTPLPSWAQRWLRHTFELATRVIVLGEVWRTYVEDVLAVQPERVTVLPNATARTASALSGRGQGEALHILFLGRLGPRKGVPELLRALADPQLSDRHWRTTVAGDGSVDTYRSYAAELGLDGRITFPGWVGPAAVAEMLADAHVLVLPSHAEGLPMSVLEAFAAGVPVICTPVGGLPEVVVNEGNGLLVPTGDIRSLTNAILRLLDDEPLRMRMAAGAFGTWQRDHSIERYAHRLTMEWQLAATRTPRRTREPVDLSTAET